MPSEIIETQGSAENQREQRKQASNSNSNEKDDQMQLAQQEQSQLVQGKEQSNNYEKTCYKCGEPGPQWNVRTHPCYNNDVESHQETFPFVALQ